MTAMALRMLILSSALASLPAVAAEKPRRLAEAHPGLVSGALSFAALGEPPGGIILKSETVQVSARELQAEVNKAPEALRDQLQKNLPAVLERMVGDKLLMEAARKSAEERKEDVSGMTSNDLLIAYFDPVLKAVKVAPEEVKEFYDRNMALCEGTPFDSMKADLETFVLRQKKEEAMAAHVRTLGQRMSITVSAAWVEKQIPLSKDNPIDRARAAGQPAFVAFGGKVCCGPDKMLPVARAIQRRLGEKVAVVYLEVKDCEILAVRYGISSIPSQIIFDKEGREVFRHTGLMTEEEIEGQLKAVGG